MRLQCFFAFLSIPLFLRTKVRAQDVEVSLFAGFDAPPYLVELIETSAGEDDKILPLILSAVRTDDTLKYSHDGPVASNSQLYSRFKGLLSTLDAELSPTSLALWDLALALRESTPRIAAHYQLWTTSVQNESSRGQNGSHVPVVVYEKGELCEDVECNTKISVNADANHHSRITLPFDRVFGDLNNLNLQTVYIDPTDIGFSDLYEKWLSKQQGTGKPYRFRYRPPPANIRDRNGPKMFINGYGAELALKRTDYIVIDDRDKSSTTESPEEIVSTDHVEADLEEISDLQPLSAKEVAEVGLKTASFILDSPQPWANLIRVTQDFPRYAASLGRRNISEAFLAEHLQNREVLLPPGYNMLWINGKAVSAQNVDAFSIFETLRHEHRLALEIQALGFSPAETISLLCHENITDAQSSLETQRFDWRDEVEGGNVIVWLNDLEHDKRYKEWPRELRAFLQRTYPGQPPSVRKNAFNMVMPVDLADFESVRTVVEQLQLFVKRGIAIRFGIVPITIKPESTTQAIVVYHLVNTYGLAAALAYMEQSAIQDRLTTPSKAIFNSVVSERKLRSGQVALELETVLDPGYVAYLGPLAKRAKDYLLRLAAFEKDAPIFLNGVAIASDESWLQGMVQRISVDLPIVQRAVFEETIPADEWVLGLFLKDAALKRNSLVVPEDEQSIKILDMTTLYKDHGFDLGSHIQYVPDNRDSSNDTTAKMDLLIITDLERKVGQEFAINALEFASNRGDVVLSIKHENADPGHTPLGPKDVESMSVFVDTYRSYLSRTQRNAIINAVQQGSRVSGLSEAKETKPLASSLGLIAGQNAIVLNGRVVGPIPDSKLFTTEDLSSLVVYERKKRIEPVVAAARSLGHISLTLNAKALSQLSSAIARSSAPDASEGMFDTRTGPRTNIFNLWNSTYSMLTSGDPATAAIGVAASIDPASEVGQRWVPIIKAMGDLDGVHVCLWLNPRGQLEELPIKRFYRSVIDTKPRFSESGQLVAPTAVFSNVPKDTLLTMALDSPSSWLVAQNSCVHDLDNIKLSGVKDQSSIKGVYKLEHILIEGHSQDTTTGKPPRGAQLTLNTADEAATAGTIVMANLGYFQFKANPGNYKLGLAEGRSRDVYQIDSAGILGTEANSGSRDIALTSFKGVTLFPRLSRRLGRESEDVLEEGELTAEQIVSQSGKIVDQALAKVGLQGAGISSYLSTGLEFGQKLFRKAGLSSEAEPKHAEINIFSVASGHLYERMLNIMILSVMKHTEHSVKFWFIEQFLSPSFKSFLPHMAAEYNFSYETVSYQWPHWLRAQKEKQRVIWGYKILFLDVLFPLDLDKIIFVDADQIVRTDMIELVRHDLQGAPYGFTPMCDDREEMEGFRFWKQGYWKNFLQGLPYHISALYVVDLRRFRAIAAGDRLRQQYHALSADPNSLSNLDQDLPNHMQMQLPIHSLPQEWLWCETWCSDESLARARTIDLCNNPMTKEPKLDRARRQVPEWTLYDEEIAALAARRRSVPLPSNASADAGAAVDGERRAAEIGVVVERGGVQEQEDIKSRSIRGVDEL